LRGCSAYASARDGRDPGRADDPDRPDGELISLAAVDLRRDDGFSVASTRS